MPQFAVVAPPQVLLGWQGKLPTSHLMLAHDVVRHEAEYREIRKRLDTENIYPPHIIMDNSVVETGGAVDVSMVHEACKIVKADVACMPDVIGNGPATVEATNMAWDSWVRTFQDIENHCRFMVIPQGTTIDEFLECASKLPTNSWIAPWWGIPRRLADSGESRAYAAYCLRGLNINRNIHLLGFGADMVDDIFACQAAKSVITSIDSAVPIRAPDFGVNAADFHPNTKLPPRGDWWETAQFNPESVKVYEKYQSWIR